MSPSFVYGVDVAGRAYRLSTSGTEWKELPYLGVDFKRVSAHAGFVWALGGDHQVYLFVAQRDGFIRVKEESYENQRWNPVNGFTDQLLPTDRFSFSNEAGTQERKRDKIRLPSLAWEWEGNWELEDNLRGVPLDRGCWMYAVDFPRTYGPAKAWNSMVRRRKWFRYRRYVAVESWAVIENVKKDPTEEPFIDISISGSELPAGAPGELSVWGVTVCGRIMFRTTVTDTNPEGSGWENVPTLPQMDACQISVGPTGLTWAIAWDGRAMVRTDVKRDCRKGKQWVIVEPPNQDAKLDYISVGTDAVWAVDRKHKVWFRRGICGPKAGDIVDAATGNGWSEMVGELAMVSLGKGNQVVGLGPPDDRRLFVRTGVTPSDVSGKTWKEMQALSGSRNRSRTESDSSLGFVSGAGGSRSKLPSLSSLRKTCSTDSSPASIRRGPSDALFSRSLDSSVEVSTARVRKLTHEAKKRALASGELSGVTMETDSTTSDETPESFDTVTQMAASRQESMAESYFSAIGEMERSDVVSAGGDTGGEVDEGLPSSDTVIDFVGPLEESGDGSSSSELPEQGQASAVPSSLEPRTVSYLSLADSQGLSSSKNSLLPLGDNEFFGQMYDGLGIASAPDDRIAFVSISAGDCEIDPHDLPNWFQGFVSQVDGGGDPWKTAIAENLLERRIREMQGFQHYNLAVERQSWVKTVKGQYLKEPSTWLKATIELETSGSSECLIDGGLITVYPEGEKTIQLALSEITCVLQMYNPSRPALCIHTPMRTWKRRPLKFSVASEKELEDWIAQIGLSYWQVQNLSGPADRDSIWSTTTRGDIFMYEPKAMMNATHAAQKKLVEMRWRQLGGSVLKVESCPLGIAWGIGWDHTGWVYTGGYGGGPWETLYSDKTKPQSDTRCFYIYENQRWNPLTGYSSRRLPTDRPSWSDYSGRVSIDKNTTKPPSGRWQWVQGGQMMCLNLTEIEWHAGRCLCSFTCGASEAGELETCFSTPSFNGPVRHSPASEAPQVKEHKAHPVCHSIPLCEWRIDFTTPGGVDTGGWQYALDFPSSYHANKGLTDYVRRRRWYRKCRTSTTGPWHNVGTTRLVDVSLQMDHSGDPNEPLGVWAVAANGDVFLREGVTVEQPMGTGWKHVPCDEPVVSISVGRWGKVWAVAKDGSVYLRHGITKHSATGSVWFHLESPTDTELTQISAGSCEVWVVDSNHRVYRRKDVMPMFPEGVAWEYVCDDVRQVSVDINDEVWAVAERARLAGSTYNGVLCRRSGRTKECPAGVGWDYGIGGGWQSICARGAPLPSK